MREAMNSDEPPVVNYQEALTEYDDLFVRSTVLSRACMGIKSPTNQHYWGSVLFTRLCVLAASLIFLLPRSRWSVKRLDHWDLTSAATLTRNIIECYFNFYYLCVEIKDDNEEWRCRWNLLNLHDCTSRIQLFSLIKDEEEVNGFKAQREELVKRLLANAFFNSLPEKRRNHLLKGDKAYLCSLEDMAEKKGISRDNFKYMYKFLSIQTHSFPASFYRAGDERGRGIYSRVEENYTYQFIKWASDFLKESIEEMEILFKDHINI